MRLIVRPDYDAVVLWAANHIVRRIGEFSPTAGRPFVLGLPTGSRPLGVYRELIRLCAEGRVSFADVVTFNMDEYVGLDAEHPQSYHRFMWDNFFSRVDIKKENVNILDGMAKDPDLECASYEERIARSQVAIDTDCPLEQTRRQVSGEWERLVERLPAQQGETPPARSGV